MNTIYRRDDRTTQYRCTICRKSKITIYRRRSEKALNELSDRKAPGVDEIPAEFFKNSGKNVNNMLYELL